MGNRGGEPVRPPGDRLGPGGARSQCHGGPTVFDRRDDIVTTTEQNLELVGRTSGSRFEVLPDVGHLAPLEAPEASTTLLQNHFGEG